MIFWKKDHRGTLVFLLHHIRSTFINNGYGIIVDVNCDHVAEVAIDQFSTVKLLIFHIAFFGRKFLSAVSS
jgi:hypothetical protein